MALGRLIFDGDNQYTEKDVRIHKLTDEVEAKIDAIPWVVDNVQSDSTTDALSAHMGKELQNQIDNLSWVNRFLSGWNCVTGLPDTNPVVSPYLYEAGNYYIISTVAAEWGTNMRPHGNSYTIWYPSTTIETEEVKVWDWYIYDGTQWVLQITTLREIVIDEWLSPTSRNPVENRAVYSALSTKQNSILDLDTIRSWAALWATSIQPWDNITELVNNADFATTWYVDTAINDAISGWVTPDINTKTFYLSSTSDLTNAQAAYDWYKSNKNPVIMYSNKAYSLWTKQSGSWNLRFFAWDYEEITRVDWTSWVERTWIILHISNDVVTQIENTNIAADFLWFLSTNNTQVTFTPTSNAHPATKKYVDDWDDAVKDYVDWEVTTINSSISSIEGDITSIQGNITTIQWDITNIQWDITNIQWDITNIEWDITNIQWDITNIQGDITNIEWDITNLEWDITNINSIITNIEWDITNIETIIWDWVSNEPYSQNWDNVNSTAPSKNAVYDKIESIEDQIDDITMWWAASDHLEQAALVWELYTINSEMFIQETPTFVNATWAQNIWQDAANTEVHIQRLWSWNATWTLKLKLRMVWESSIDLVVEVREWTYQTVSATEAWWYWNPNQVIASWTLSHSNITTSWAEYTVNLNALVGWNRWQLLDIVIYQAWRVINTTNYYQVAWDESQYTEAYRVITYNGSTYTQTDKPGYCVSEAFADKLFCKVWPTQETSMTATTISWSTWWADSYGQTDATINFTATDTTWVSWMGKYRVYIDCNATNHTSWCFLEWAKVTMADGSIKNIEDVEVGDMVLSYNVETWEYVPARVTVMLSHIFCINDINKITMWNDVLDIAWIHPVYALAKWSEELAYIPANKLELWDKVFTDGWELKEITERSEYKYLDRLFNFAVEWTHNCFVEGCLTVFE